MRLDCDIVVVGAGPAGCSAAFSARRQGVDVLLLEKKTRVGQPVQCGEFVPKLALKGLDLGGGLVRQETEYMETHLPGGETVRTKGPGYIVDRAELDRRLTLEAVQVGARLLTGARALRLLEEGVEVEHRGQRASVSARVVIGADGPRSVVGRSIGEVNLAFALGVQYEVLLRERLPDTHVYFDEAFRGGYGWLFPRGRTANVGVGISMPPWGALEDENRDRLGDTVIPAQAGIQTENIDSPTDSHFRGNDGSQPIFRGLTGPAAAFRGMTGAGETEAWALLDRFVDRLAAEGRIEPGGVVSRTAGLIPVGGPLRTVKGNVMLVGDAAGQTHPITGAGIAQALECGHMAGEIAGGAVRRDRLDSLTEYEAEWRDVFGDWFQVAVDRRREMEACWGKEPLDDLMKRCWVAFPAYRRWPG